MANGGPDRVAQPQESLTLNGIESKDDHEIVTYQWHLVSGNSSAVIEVSDQSLLGCLSDHRFLSDCKST